MAHFHRPPTLNKSVSSSCQPLVNLKKLDSRLRISKIGLARCFEGGNVVETWSNRWRFPIDYEARGGSNHSIYDQRDPEQKRFPNYRGRYPSLDSRNPRRLQETMRLWGRSLYFSPYRFHSCSSFLICTRCWWTNFESMGPFHLRDTRKMKIPPPWSLFKNPPISNFHKPSETGLSFT